LKKGKNIFDLTSGRLFATLQVLFFIYAKFLQENPGNMAKLSAAKGRINECDESSIDGRNSRGCLPFPFTTLVDCITKVTIENERVHPRTVESSDDRLDHA
jgi:hypothetical protein